MEEDYVENFVIPELEEKKRRLSQIRNMRKPIRMNEIQNHA